MSSWSVNAPVPGGTGGKTPRNPTEKDTLKGKTVFITGASRGIGLQCALRFARDGCNVVIAAKSVTVDPRLPGTIFTAAKEIEDAGGKALPVVCDIRFEDQIINAVNKAVETFGGIDICINNASAIAPHLMMELDTKRFDLINQINARGTYLVTRHCLPHLIESAKKGRNPHVLTMAPPMQSLTGNWLSGRVGYGMGKFAMSMLTLGSAEEFKQYGIASNALWPYLVVDTAAVTNVLMGKGAAPRLMTPRLIADAAYVMVLQPVTWTGNFVLDEPFLRLLGVKDFRHYQVDPSLDPSQLIGMPEKANAPNPFVNFGMPEIMVKL
ncbi:hypothetical protein SmJEL517_g03578 [Synchytrium microbalum]|uniref:Hydroxysteroid dehydrogenase-like protein 2 n=1 Tax=Synchytrium microbalum TaxID=1806994 RepID=A0A507C3J3_9FUNG|nr:uncharacterized protein SmJEL517_g03578 [Synchytrium microbalum]TPX33629.1 hypothetical protein SmJEL517_g03578 [Synchytrium microbalum]